MFAPPSLFTHPFLPKPPCWRGETVASGGAQARGLWYDTDMTGKVEAVAVKDGQPGEDQSGVTSDW